MSQPVPKACVVVTLSSPLGLPLEFGEQDLRRCKLAQHILRGPVEQLALLGQDEAARMPVKQGNVQIPFERADVAAHRGLADAQRLARVRETPRFGGSMEYPQFVPVQGHSLSSAIAGAYSAACASVSRLAR